MASQAEPKSAAFRLPIWIGTSLFCAIALFFLWQEHRAHLLGALPYLLLLSCPLIHIFMHHGHGHGHDHGGSSPAGGNQEDSHHHGDAL